MSSEITISFILIIVFIGILFFILFDELKKIMKQNKLIAEELEIDVSNEEIWPKD